MISLTINEFNNFLGDNKKSNSKYQIRKKTGFQHKYDGKNSIAMSFDVLDLVSQEEIRFTINYDGGKVDIYPNEVVVFGNRTIEKLDGISFLNDLHEANQCCPYLKHVFKENESVIKSNMKKFDDALIGNEVKATLEVATPLSNAEKTKKQTPALSVKPFKNFRQINLPAIDSDVDKGLFLNAGSKPVLLYGPAGSGKSYGVKEFKRKLEISSGVPVSYYSKLLTKEMDRSDLIGYPGLDGYNYGPLSKALMSGRDGNLTIAFFDEIGRIKDTSVFFNLYGGDFYSIETGNQIELVQLTVNENETAWFQISDKRKAQGLIQFENEKITMENNGDNPVFQNLSEQKIEELSAHGKIPLIHQKDYNRFNFDNIAISSFKTQEVVSCPVENLLVVAAANVGTQYVSHFKIGTDIAYDSRWAFVETKAPTTKDYVRKFEFLLEQGLERGYLKWGLSEKKSKDTIKKFGKNIHDLFDGIKKLVDQKALGAPGNINYRVFEEMANNLAMYVNPNKIALKEVVENQYKSIIRHEEGADKRIPVQTELMSISSVVKLVLGTGEAKNVIKDISIESEKTLTKEREAEKSSSLGNLIDSTMINDPSEQIINDAGISR